MLVVPGAIAFPAAEAVMFIATKADDALQDLAEMWVTYQSDDGIIHGPITHLLAKAAEAGTQVCHALGDENLLDTISAGQGGAALTLTTYNCTTVNDLAGKYLAVYSGDDAGIALQNYSRSWCEIHMPKARCGPSFGEWRQDSAGRMRDELW